MPMGAIQVKDVPEELHEALRRRAIQEGMTMADYVLDLIRRDLGLPSRREWLERLATSEPVDLAPASSRRRFTTPGPSGTPRSPPP